MLLHLPLDHSPPARTPPGACRDRARDSNTTEGPMPERTMTIDGVRVPRFLYGTAWKEDDTQRLTEQALRLGFRGIDTANQRRHYHEAGVGRAVAAALGAGLLTREELFLQTKY